jgi:hypothetical protein
MGQATLDLPDPLEKPSPAPTTSADDLLAQLAGDEIDRLLADADNGKSPTAVPPPPPVAESLEPAPTPPPVADTAVTQTVAATPAAATPATEAAATAVATQAEAPAPEQDEVETSSSERTELAAGELARQSTELPEVDATLPFFLKPLVWLSSPLDSAPEEWRELIGKVAILTMVNAIAVLAYVIVFRRHH